jgi:hypothetical protein
MIKLPIAFFSYARENRKPQLVQFFEDLRIEIEERAGWVDGDSPVTFSDKESLRLMEFWKSDIESALQTAAVLVCITSPAYFRKEFCGKEFYLFDQRRRLGIPSAGQPRPVILPVIWLPVEDGLPPMMDDVTNVPSDVVDQYRTGGLKDLMASDAKAYSKCLKAFATSIVAAWRQHSDMPRLSQVLDFRDIPNSFEGGDWREAVDAAGWIRGPEVVNFLFATGTRTQRPHPPGRYGELTSEWRPYLPPHSDTIRDQAKDVAQRGAFKYREIDFVVADGGVPGRPQPVAPEILRQRLIDAKERKNLLVALTDPMTVTGEASLPLRLLDALWWEGTAVVFPWNDHVDEWNHAQLHSSLTEICPIISQTPSPQVSGPIRDPVELKVKLADTLAQMRIAVTKLEAMKKPAVDEPPPAVGSSRGGAL